MVSFVTLNWDRDPSLFYTTRSIKSFANINVAVLVSNKAFENIFLKFVIKIHPLLVFPLYLLLVD